MAEAPATTIGFVGLGRMGGSMAARFLAAGYTVYGEDRDRTRAHELERAGLQWRETPREVGEATYIGVTSSPNDCGLAVVASVPHWNIPGPSAGDGRVEEGRVSPPR